MVTYFFYFMGREKVGQKDSKLATDSFLIGNPLSGKTQGERALEKESIVVQEVYYSGSDVLFMGV